MVLRQECEICPQDGAGDAAAEAGGHAGMINLSFFPSRRLAFYMVRLFLTRSLAVMIALILILMTLDLLGESGKILAVPGNGDAQLWHYVALRLPLLVSRFLPFSVLLGTLIAFVGLNQHSEVVAMKAAGLSAHQILAPLVIASIGIAIALFAFNETVVVKSGRVVTAWSDNDYKPVPPESGILSNVWLLNGDDLVRAGLVIGQGRNLRVQNLQIYDRGGGILRRTIMAAKAVPRPSANDWLLEDVRIYDAGMNVISSQPQLPALAGVTAGQLTLAKVDPAELDYWTLKQRIAELEAAGRPADQARAGLAHKISGPISTLLMPLLAAVAAFGLARSGQVLARAAIGMALGFAYFVADNFSLAMGNAGAYPPLIAAWAPFLLFLLIGETVLVRTEE
jgi:lipopolysaccharide export system permease protein